MCKGATFCGHGIFLTVAIRCCHIEQTDRYKKVDRRLRGLLNELKFKKSRDQVRINNSGPCTNLLESHCHSMYNLSNTHPITLMQLQHAGTTACRFNTELPYRLPTVVNSTV